MSEWRIEEIAQALGVAPQRGEHSGIGPEWLARGVSTDTRTLQPGQIFVALRGERFDAHDHLAEATEKGAAALVIAESALMGGGLHLPDRGSGVAVFAAEDTLVALQDLARFHRERLTGTVLGVTGSNGKTSAKEMFFGLLVQIAGGEGVFASRGNLNNHIGVPLSLLEARVDDRFVVIEMGMNHAGEIELLSEIVRPHHALITCIAGAHIENFPETGLAGIARAKLEILAGMPEDATLAFHASSPHAEFALEAAPPKGVHLLFFDVHRESVGEHGDIRPVQAVLDKIRAFHPESAPPDALRHAVAESVRCDANGLIFRWRETGLEVRAPAYSNAIQAQNLIGCLGLLHAIGLDAARLATAAHAVRPLSPRRFTMHRIPRPDRAPQLLIDDSYNANPASFEAAVRALRQILPDGRLALIAGPMAELGDAAARGHRLVGLAAAQAGYEFLAVCGGQDAEWIQEAFAVGRDDPSAGSDAAGAVLRAKDSQELLERLQSEVDLAAFDGILVKGSRSARMERIADALASKAISESQAGASGPPGGES